MLNRADKFLETHKCIYKLQFGFRSKHSINHVLTEITETNRKSLDNGKHAFGVFIDLQKAFDTVNHSILGIGRKWFQSYLTNRTQYTSIQGFESAPKQTKHGVPQGSVLGPLLFLVYINYLHRAIKNSRVYHFADDTNLLNINLTQRKCKTKLFMTQNIYINGYLLIKSL